MPEHLENHTHVQSHDYVKGCPCAQEKPEKILSSYLCGRPGGQEVNTKAELLAAWLNVEGMHTALGKDS